MDLVWPQTRADISDIHRVGKRNAVEAAMRSPLYKGRLAHIDLDKLDDPAEWSKIPLLTKEELRAIPVSDFHDAFCIAPRSDVVEYWRSGGAT